VGWGTRANGEHLEAAGGTGACQDAAAARSPGGDTRESCSVVGWYGGWGRQQPNIVRCWAPNAAGTARARVGRGRGRTAAHGSGTRNRRRAHADLCGRALPCGDVADNRRRRSSAHRHWQRAAASSNAACDAYGNLIRPFWNRTDTSRFLWEFAIRCKGARQPFFSRFWQPYRLPEPAGARPITPDTAALFLLPPPRRPALPAPV